MAESRSAAYCGGTFCGECHTGGEDRQKEVFTVDKHLKSYFPRFALRQSEGQKQPLGRSGGYLTLGGGLLEYYSKDGTLGMIAPPGSLILKDRRGRRRTLFMPGVPTLHRNADPLGRAHRGHRRA